jgi:hypothetical protein
MNISQTQRRAAPQIAAKLNAINHGGSTLACKTTHFGNYKQSCSYLGMSILASLSLSLQFWLLLKFGI